MNLVIYIVCGAFVVFNLFIFAYNVVGDKKPSKQLRISACCWIIGFAIDFVAQRFIPMQYVMDGNIPLILFFMMMLNSVWTIRNVFKSMVVAVFDSDFLKIDELDDDDDLDDDFDDDFSDRL